MSLYPSLEDMMLDGLTKAQLRHEQQQNNQQMIELGHDVLQDTTGASAPPLYQDTITGPLYPSLGDYMGLQITEDMIRPFYDQQTSAVVPGSQGVNVADNTIAPLTNQSLAYSATKVTHNLRELTLCKDKDGKIGLRLRAVNNGLFVCLVIKTSPAALAGLRFGDQIIRINDKEVAGMSMDDGHKLLKKCPINNIKVVVRDRPFERTIVLHKDSTNHVGFQFKNGKITGLVKDSSAARNGLLTDHQILEVNGQNVVGLKDKELVNIIDAKDVKVISITVMPYCLYQHMVDKMAGSLLTSIMDHSQPVF